MKKSDTVRTMDDFAQACGISRPTLSKYFQDPDSVRSSTRQRIEAALKEYDFNPSFYAINMNRERTRNIGILVPMLSDPFYAEMVRQFEVLCLNAGYWAVVISSHGSPDLEARAVQTLLSLRIAGALVAPIGYNSDVESLRRLADATPVVMFDAGIEGLAPLVGSDNFQSTAVMTDYLCRTGSAPVFLGIPPVNENATERRQGYLAAMQRNGFEPKTIEVTEPDWNFEQIGFRLMSKLISEGKGAGLTLMCASDRLAFGAMSAAFQSGLKIGIGQGYDLRIAGHDDHPLSRYMNPPLTTVEQPYGAIANRCFDMLQDVIASGRPVSSLDAVTRVETTLRMRASA